MSFALVFLFFLFHIPQLQSDQSLVSAAGSGTSCSHNSTSQTAYVLDGNFMAKQAGAGAILSFWLNGEEPSCPFVSVSFFNKQQMSLTHYFFDEIQQTAPKGWHCRTDKLPDRCVQWKQQAACWYLELQ